MAKDPAVLFYTSDFLSGTFTMTHEQVGKYIRLLCLQHQKGVLSEKDMINVCGTYDEDVFLKFEKSGKTFFNKRMKDEADRRQNFCESRRKSRQGAKNQTTNKKTYVERMETETEIIDETVIVFDTEKQKFKNDFRWKEKFCRDKSISLPELEMKMDQFISDIELREDFKPLKELKSHFTNTFNKQKNGHSATQPGGKHSGSKLLIASLKQDFAARGKEAT